MQSPSPTQSIPVYRSMDLTVVSGANLGDALSFADELDLDDTYELHKGAKQHRLSLQSDGEGGFQIAPDTGTGTIGATLHMDSCLTLMSGNGSTTEVLVLVEVDTRGDVENIFALPLAQLAPRQGYTLVGINRDNARTKFAQVACVSFTKGTHITLPSGEQKRVEDLAVGDGVLTRDDGSQKIRWIGHATVRAIGDFAPIRVKAGALHNENDLLVSPDHRLFIYQRSDAVGAGRAEVLVRARHLVNGDTVVREDGGYVDYFQLLFEQHQIIYAEGIAAETLLVDTRTSPLLPPELTAELAQSLLDHASSNHGRFEIGENLLNHPDMAKLLKRASTR